MDNEQLCEAYRVGCKAEIEVKLDKLRVEIKYNRELFDERVKSSDKALDLAREILNTRMELENGIRNELREQTVTFITRREFYTVMTLITAMMAIAFSFLVFFK